LEVLVRPEFELLRECLEQSDRLGSAAADAFDDMAEAIEKGVIEKLSVRQRDWLLDKCAQLGIETGAANLVSTGAVKPTSAERASLKAFHESLGPKPLKPPGRRA
jgi:hypothetical protein